MPRAVVFDAFGTLFSVEPLQRKLRPAALEAWFERLLHSATSLTLAGRFVPFSDLAELLAGAGLADRVSELVSVEEIELYKPHPAVYRHAAERLGVEPRRITLIAAHAWDAVGAKQAGF